MLILTLFWCTFFFRFGHKCSQQKVGCRETGRTEEAVFAKRRGKRTLFVKELIVSHSGWHFYFYSQVHYGEGRITSTHNTKGKIEEPWVTVKGRYTVVAGDRTG